MINLSRDSLCLLEKCLNNHAPNFITIINDAKTIYTPKIYKELREVVGDELCLKGFNEDYEPNEYGLRLEALIDEIGRLFM